MNIVFGYFRGIVSEMKKVNWPTWSVLFQNFIAVILGMLLFTIVVGVFDYLFIKALAFIIK